MSESKSDERIKTLEGENKALRVALAVKEQRRKDREQEWVAEANRLTRERDEARAQADGLAKALRGVSKGIEAHMYLNDPPADENMDEYDYMMKPLWEAARAALAALPKEDDDA